MKKLSFILVGLLISIGVTLAQTQISKVIESGINQKAVITQTGQGDMISNVTQSNANNLATVTQINPGLVLENDILSDVVQSGANNEATVTQNHSETEGSLVLLKALLNQSGNDNKAMQKQGPHSQMGTVYAEIMQGGNWNVASQTQYKSNNYAAIDQQGNGNTATQAQDVETIDEFEGTSNTASIVQAGDIGYALQDQHGWANEVSATQSGGSGNKSTQLQKDYSWKNIASVSQTGSDNEAVQEQIGNLNKAKIDQTGVGNYANQSHASVGTRPDGVYSPLNEAEIIQMGGDGNVATQNQVMLDGVYLAATDANYAFIQQDGSTNKAYQTQTGGLNHSSISQTGVGNMATVIQNQSLIP